jgi:hypothetical protein
MSKGGDLQRKLGDLLERAVTLATGRSRPPDLGTVLLGEAERCVIEGPAGPTIPNVFVVAAGEIPEPPERAAIERRLEDHIVEAAVYLGRRFDGPIDVRLAPGGRRPEIETAFAVGDLPAWAVLTAADDDEPVTVHHNRAVIGVSRKHALLWREAGRVWIADLQSANGTYVNGDPVYDVVEVRRSDLILFGNAGFVFGMA